jgi:hypothetical protein
MDLVSSLERRSLANIGDWDDRVRHLLVRLRGPEAIYGLKIERFLRAPENVAEIRRVF